MRIGCSVGPFPDAIDEVPEVFDFVELAIGEMEISPDEVDRKKLRQELERNDLDLVVHLPFRQALVTGVDELDSANIEYQKRLLSFAKEVDAEKAVVHLNNRYGISQDEPHLDALKDIMTRIARIGERKRITVVFENVPAEDGSGAIELMELGQLARDLGVKMCFDTGHAYLEGEQDLVDEFLEEYLDVVDHLHVQDCMRGRDAHVAVNHGDIDWERTGEKLADFDGTATIEVFSEDMDYQIISRDKFLDFCRE